MLKQKKLLWLIPVMLISLLLTNFLYADLFEEMAEQNFPFDDVPKTAWYYLDVRGAFYNHLINGKSETKFAPDDYMTNAEAVKLAACIHQLRNVDAVDFPKGIKPWYKPYVDYAKTNNLISSDYDWNQNINRAGYMQIFAQILTDGEASLNNVPDNSIPDISMSHPNADAIYKLYRAGIVQGVDASGSCKPDTFIKRSEVAVILTRMMFNDRRLDKDFAVDMPELVIEKQPQGLIEKLGVIVRLEVIANGGKAPLTYKWEYREKGSGDDFTESKAEGSKTNVLNPPVEEKKYDYRCVIIDADGKSIMSDIATVEEKIDPLTITKQPVGHEGVSGRMVELNVEVAGGKKPYTYQWYYTVGGIGVPMKSEGEGNKTAKLKVPIELINYSYYCLINDAVGNTVTSNWVDVKSKSNFLDF